LQTGKKEGIVLILETLKDRKFWIRLNTTIDYFNLPIANLRIKIPLISDVSFSGLNGLPRRSF
jgi:hypothetical protein